MISMRKLLLSMAWVIACVAALFAPHAPAADQLQFNRDIRPILSENCLTCHGPDAAARQADLRLDVWEDAGEVRGRESLLEHFRGWRRV